PGVAVRRLDLDHVGAEIRQDHRRAGAGDEARHVDDLQAGKDVVFGHGWLRLGWRMMAARRVSGPGSSAPAWRGRPTCPRPCPRWRRRRRTATPRARGPDP